MPTTPVLQLPYPAETDPADVPADLGELAVAIEAVRGQPNGLASLDAGGKMPSSQAPVAPLVTPLPAPSYDGQEVTLVDNVALPGYTWRLRWNATDGRWAFVGGTALRAVVAASETTSTIGAYVNLATSGPLLTVPRAGDYAVRFGCTMIDSAAGSQIVMGLDTGNFAAPALVEARGHISAANYHLTLFTKALPTGLAAGAE